MVKINFENENYRQEKRRTVNFYAVDEKSSMNSERRENKQEYVTSCEKKIENRKQKRRERTILMILMC